MRMSNRMTALIPDASMNFCQATKIDAHKNKKYRVRTKAHITVITVHISTFDKFQRVAKQIFRWYN